MTLIAFVGPIPPPVSGFSNACAFMLATFKKRFSVVVFDRAPSSGRMRLTVLEQSVRPLAFLGLCLKGRKIVTYLALSGGLGQLVDSCYLILSKMFRKQIVVHHHSFAYINAPSYLNKFIFALTRAEIHIVLSRGMGDALIRIFHLNPGRVRVLSNASMAYYAGGADHMQVDQGAPVRLGFLSNITLEKGIAEFFYVLGKLNSSGVRYRARIAGPVSSDALPVFNSLMRASTDVEYLGAVYGVEKSSFYRELDILLFPTNYANEAEPLVIHEALQCGVYVLANGRGAIAEVLENGAGQVFAKEDFVDKASKAVFEFSGNRDGLAQARRAAWEQGKRMHAAAGFELESLLDCVANVS